MTNPSASDPIDTSTLLTSGGAAKLADVDPATIRLWARSGKLRCERASGGQRLFSYRDVVALLERRSDAHRG